MSDQDRIRWDERWLAREGDPSKVHPVMLKLDELLSNQTLDAKIGAALDIACGRGQNSLYLADLGYFVTGIDISQVALDKARVEAEASQLASRTLFVQMDLDEDRLPSGPFDLICVTRFLDRRLLPAMRQAIKPGGNIIYVTRHPGILKEYPNTQSSFLLEEGEMLNWFPGWKVHLYHEGPVEAEIIVQKPGSG
jgi:tellurite methyltransferase